MGSAENQAHMENCPQCKSLLEECQVVDAKLQKLASVRLGTNIAMNCPDERIWFDVAAGTLPETESFQYLQHAAECNSCGRKLVAATRMFADDLSPDEQKTMSALSSSSAEAQQKLSQRLASNAASAPVIVQKVPAKPKRHFWKPLSFSVAGAAIAITAILAFIFFNRHDSTEDVEKLLAQTYTENRIMEMRIPYARHAPIRQQRNGDAGSILNIPESFRRAADQIAKGVKNHPDNPKWLLQQAKLDLLDSRYQAALSTLNKIDNSEASMDIVLIKAIALSQLGQADKNPTISKEAMNLLEIILQKEPNNIVALFDEALLCEQSEMYECAARDWERVIALDKDPGWVKEAQDHLDSIQKKKKTRALNISQLQDPVHAIQQLNSGEEVSNEAREQYLNIAVNQWLTRSQHPLVNKTLDRLAQVLRSNQHDPWLTDYLSASASDEGDYQLQSAIIANYEGKTELGLQEASQAQRAFEITGNLAGIIWSKYEQVYALRRKSQPTACLKEIDKAWPVIRDRNYRWLQLQLGMERSVCEGMRGNLDQAATLAC